MTHDVLAKSSSCVSPLDHLIAPGGALPVNEIRRVIAFHLATRCWPDKSVKDLTRDAREIEKFIEGPLFEQR